MGECWAATMAATKAAQTADLMAPPLAVVTVAEMVASSEVLTAYKRV